MMKLRLLAASLAVSMVVCLTALGTASAADEWFVLGEKSLKSVDQGVDIKSEGSRWKKDIKQMKFSADGADIEVTKVVLHWNNRPDQTITDIGVIKAGGQSVPRDAPMRKSQLTGVTIQYKILGDRTTAVMKVWGYD